MFRLAETAAVVLDCISWLEEHDRIRRLATVVMPDHLHAVMELRNAPLGSVMHSLKSFSAKQVNAVLARSGSVWQRQYHEASLRDENAVRNAIRYCLANPVRAGLVANPREYPYCYCKFPIDTL